MSNGFARYPLGAVFVLALILAASVVAAQPTAEEESLLERLEERFEALPVSNGAVLKPRAGQAGYRSIEVTDRGVAVDGEVVAGEALTARLGASDAELVAELAEIESTSPGRLRGLLTPVAAAPPAEAAEPEAPEAPEPPLEAPPAPEGPEPPLRRVGDQVRVGSSLLIEANEEARDVVVVGGSLTTEGRVRGDAVVVGGPAMVNGEVDGEVVVVGGALNLGPKARIGRNVQTVGGSVIAHPSAVVEGEINEVGLWGPWAGFDDWDWDFGDFRPRFHPWGHFLGIVWHLILLATLALVVCFILWLVPGKVEQLSARASRQPWKAGLVGFLAQVLFLPLLALFTLLTFCLGALLIPFIAVFLVIVALVGFAAVALAVGRLLEGRFGWRLASPYAAALVGLAAIGIWSLLAEALEIEGTPLVFFALVIGLFGCLIWYVAWTVGFGAFVVTWFESRRATPLPPAGALAPLPPLPTPPAGSVPPAEPAPPAPGDAGPAGPGGEAPAGGDDSEVRPR